jgi:hypothetical protein
VKKKWATCGGSRWPWGFDGSESLKGDWVGEASHRHFDDEAGIIEGREVGGTSNNYPGADRRFGEDRPDRRGKRSESKTSNVSF